MTNIKIQESDKGYSSFGGLFVFQGMWNKLLSRTSWKSKLPDTPKASKKFEDLALGFASDAQCLRDMNQRALDSGFQALCGERVLSDKSYGDFLREFSGNQIDELNRQLAMSAYLSRAAVKRNQKSMIFDFDSTSNQQFGEKMEGVAYSGEKKFECLSTMHVFDELGNKYYVDVRPGNTHTSDKISKIIHMVLNQMPRKGSYAAEELNFPWLNKVYKKNFRVYGRADAGYSNSEFMNACLAKDVGFVVRLKADMLAPHIWKIKNWKDPKAKKIKKKRRDGSIELVDKTIRFYDDRDCEIGSTIYTSSLVAKPLRLVCLRAKKKGCLGISEEDYDYFAWASNIGEHEMNNEKLIYFYRKRGSAENYIREIKNGFDYHHYPCLKLNANRAYALIGGFAYNVMRLIALLDNPDKPHFAKAIRNKILFLPCQVVRTAGQVYFKFMTDQYRRMEIWLKKLKFTQLGFT
jgi:hypothetical protein